MKKLLIFLIALLSLYSVQSQTITDTASLRSYINTNIVPNASGSITAAKMNNVLNGIATLMKNYAVDSAWWLAPDTLVLGRRGGYAAYKVRIAISPAGAETDPTVSAAAKSISSGDVTNWNSKQAALSGSSTVSIIANVVSAANTTALWNANQLQGRSVSSTAPTTSQVLSWDGAAWSPATVTGAADGNNYTTGNTFNTGTGILTQTRSGLSSLTVDLDGRYFDNITRVDSITRYYKDGVVIFADTLFTTNLARPLYAIDQYTIGVKNDSAAWNANKLQGRAIASTAPTDGQAMVWDNAGSTWKPGTVSGSGGISDGDKGDVTVSGSGSTFTIDNNVVSDAKIRQSAALSVLGRSANSTGNIADISASVNGQVLQHNGTSLVFDSVDFAKVKNTPQVNPGVYIAPAQAFNPGFLVVASAIVRTTGTATHGTAMLYEILDNSTSHNYSFIDSAYGSTGDKRLIVRFPKVKNVVNMTTTPDESWAKYGITLGPSVNISDASIAVWRQDELGVRLRGDGTTTWTKNGLYASSFNLSVYNTGDGGTSLEILNNYYVDYDKINIQYIGTNDYRIKRIYSGLGAYYARFVLMDRFGNPVTTAPTSSDEILITNGGSFTRQVFMDTWANSGSNNYNMFITSSFNFWITGLFEAYMVAAPVSTTNIQVRWQSYPSATSYKIYRSNTLYGTRTLLYSGTDFRFDDTGLSSGAVYFYHMVAVVSGVDTYVTYFRTNTY